MAKLIITTTRTDISKPWLKIEPSTISTMFSPEEVDVLSETKNFVESLPGFISAQFNTIDDYNTQRIFEFDTVENAQATNDVLYNPVVNTPFYERDQIIKKKRAELGLEYTINSIIE